MTKPEVVIYHNAEILSAAVAARLVTRLVDIQRVKKSASLVLTGGTTGIAVLRELHNSPARDAIDWSRLDLYWGDERFVPSNDPERNELQAREALLNHVSLDDSRIHAMAASDGAYGDDPDAAAAAYAEFLAKQASAEPHGSDSPDTLHEQPHHRVPHFDITLLGMGGEGHTASIFPETPAVYEQDRSVVAVRNCPKPPPTRISLTLPAIQHSQEVWIMTTGAAKADAVALALSGAGEVQIPVAGAQGTRRTLWLLDKSAAGKLSHIYQAPMA